MKKWILLFLLLMSGCDQSIVTKNGIDEKKLIETVNRSQSGMLFYEDSLNEAQAITKLGLQKKQVASIRLYESIVSIDDSLIAIIERDAMSKKELKQLLKAYVNTHHQTHHTPLKSMILSYEKQDIVLVSENCGTIKASIQKAE